MLALYQTIISAIQSINQRQTYIQISDSECDGSRYQSIPVIVRGQTELSYYQTSIVTRCETMQLSRTDININGADTLQLMQ